MTLDPSEITLQHAPRRRGDVTAVELDGELVVYESERGGVHKLDTVATVLWHCFDGSVTLAEIVEDLQTVFDRDPQVLASDVVDYVRELGHVGLLEGVRPASEPEPDSGKRG